MGKQVNFYMTDSDEQDFIRFVRSDRNVGIFMYTMPTEDIPLLTELPRQGVPFWLALWLWDRDNSPKPKVDFVREQRYYVVDECPSEVIEFSRSHLDEGRLVRGRIWAEMAVWQSDQTLLHKSESFQKWFDRLANWIKRHSVKDKHGDYVLPGAAEYAKRGGKLVQAVFAKSVKHFYHEVDEGAEDKGLESL